MRRSGTGGGGTVADQVMRRVDRMLRQRVYGRSIGLAGPAGSDSGGSVGRVVDGALRIPDGFDLGEFDVEEFE